MSAVLDDRFERALDEELRKLQACQEAKQLQSCSRCDAFIGCDVRKSYVSAVYNSMSKGDSGGFEF
ncbi:MAG: hypothetical protein JXK05_10635 [Campylobacterales bacterium]|nr:hypothetical protein [Campylobacterales bacterium]